MLVHCTGEWRSSGRCCQLCPWLTPWWWQLHWVSGEQRIETTKNRHTLFYSFNRLLLNTEQGELHLEERDLREKHQCLQSQLHGLLSRILCSSKSQFLSFCPHPHSSDHYLVILILIFIKMLLLEVTISFAPFFILLITDNPEIPDPIHPNVIPPTAYSLSPERVFFWSMLLSSKIDTISKRCCFHLASQVGLFLHSEQII